MFLYKVGNTVFRGAVLAFMSSDLDVRRLVATVTVPADVLAARNAISALFSQVRSLRRRTPDVFVCTMTSVHAITTYACSRRVVFAARRRPNAPYVGLA